MYYSNIVKKGKGMLDLALQVDILSYNLVYECDTCHRYQPAKFQIFRFTLIENSSHQNRGIKDN